MLFHIIVIFLFFFVLRKLLMMLLSNNIPPEIDYSTIPEKELEELNFGKEFKFGAATAAYQIEKSTGESNWSDFEKEVDENGKQRSPPHNDACEAMEHFDQDLALMKNANLKMYRFGVSWSSIEKERGVYDDEYISKYVQQCDKLKEAGIEPLITLWHFEYPAFLSREGGLLAPTFIKDFCNFTTHVITLLKGHCNYYYTINEPLGYTLLAYLGGTFPPGEKMSFKNFFKASAVLMECHAKCYECIHDQIKNAKVSLTNQIIPLIPKHKWSLIETAIASAANGFLNRPYMDCLITGTLEFRPLGIPLFKKEIQGLKNSIDFHGINHYTCVYTTINPRDWNEFPLVNRRPNNQFPLSDFHWSCIPGSLAMVMKWVNQIWNPLCLPIIISENGISDSNDSIREWFVMNSLAHLRRAINQGVPVHSYLAWSLLDNFEWADGYTQHFGFIKVDFASQERTPQPSFEAYSKLASLSK